jgi:excisionase family DNA binding protein
VSAMTSERPITTTEAAALAGVSPRMIRHYVKTGRITKADTIGPTMVFNRADVLALAETIERRWRKPVEVAS